MYNDYENMNPEENGQDTPVYGSGSNSDNTEENTETYSDWSEPIYRTPESAPVYSPNHYGAKDRYGSYTPYEEPRPAPEKKRSGGALKSVALVLVCAIICSLCSAAAAWIVVDFRLASGDAGKQVVIGGSPVSNDRADEGGSDTQPTGETMTATEIYSMSLTQVVGVNSSTVGTNIFGQPTSKAVTGSGFVISEDGYILTNYHVIEYSVLDNYDLAVMFNDGTEYPAKIIGYDEANDVAVIKIEASGLNPVVFGDSTAMQVGQTVYPVGNPLGELTYTMTFGIISALDRVIATDAYTKINMFQFDAAVNSGNSGGPIYNEYGEVLGIVTAKYADDGVEGLGFAIPMNDVITIITDLIESGYVGGRARLGIEVQTMDASFANYYNVPQGAYVRMVESGSCAEKAGMKIGDIIVALGDTTITTKEELTAELRNYNAGDTATITVHRSGKNEVLTVTFDEKTL